MKELLTFVCLWAWIVLLGFVLFWGYPVFGGPIYLQACSKTECIAAVDAPFSTQTILYSASAIGDSVDCPGKCAIVGTPAGTTWHVMGHWVDVSCRVSGGDYCVWNRALFTPEMVKHLQKELSK